MELDRYLFPGNEKEPRLGARTDGVLIVQNGGTVYERYAREHTATTKHVMWSVSKTILALMYGVAHQEKRFQLDDSICKFIKSSDPKKCEIKVRHVLEWTTGIDWVEEYENSGRPKDSSILAMIFGEGHENMAQFVLKQPISYPPATSWRYSSGDTMLGAEVLEGIYQNKNLREVFKTQLLKKIGAKNTIWEGDKSGTIAAAYFLQSVPRDLALFGQLMMNDGKWKEEQIVSKDFLKFMQTVPETFKSKANRPAHDGANISGAHLWLNDPQGSDADIPWEEAPSDAYAALGHWGQFLVVIPSLKVVAVRVGDNRDKTVRSKDFVNLVAKIFKEQP